MRILIPALALFFSVKSIAYDYDALLNNASFVDAAMCKIVLQKQKGIEHQNASYKSLDIVFEGLIANNENLNQEKLNMLMEDVNNYLFNKLVTSSNGSLTMLQINMENLVESCLKDFSKGK